MNVCMDEWKGGCMGGCMDGYLRHSVKSIPIVYSSNSNRMNFSTRAK